MENQESAEVQRVEHPDLVANKGTKEKKERRAIKVTPEKLALKETRVTKVMLVQPV
jgi:hypothetical protein